MRNLEQNNIPEVVEKAPVRSPRISESIKRFGKKIALVLGLGVAAGGVGATTGCFFDAQGLAAPDAKTDSRPVDDGSFDGGIDGGDAETTDGGSDGGIDAEIDAEVPVEICDEEGDEDGNGVEGCDDAACDQQLDPTNMQCQPNGETGCTDNGDNDNDGLIDCDDPDCNNAPTCTAGGETCDNLVDDDFDGLVDCEDPECANDNHCIGATENCSNGVDDDGDGDVDGDDDNCDALSCGIGCTWEYGVQTEGLCYNNKDDDGDGLIDNADPDCLSTGTEDCYDGSDNDGDGFPDCQDGDCAGEPKCVVWHYTASCINDNPGDTCWTSAAFPDHEGHCSETQVDGEYTCVPQNLSSYTYYPNAQ